MTAYKWRRVEFRYRGVSVIDATSCVSQGAWAALGEQLRSPALATQIESHWLLESIRDPFAASEVVHRSPHVIGELRRAGKTCGVPWWRESCETTARLHRGRVQLAAEVMWTAEASSPLAERRSAKFACRWRECLSAPPRSRSSSAQKRTVETRDQAFAVLPSASESSPGSELSNPFAVAPDHDESSSPAERTL